MKLALHWATGKDLQLKAKLRHSIFVRGLYWEPKREPQEYNSNIMECQDPDPGRYIPIIFLEFPVWGSQ